MKRKGKNFFDRIKIKNFQDIQNFKEEFENGKITEKEIPEAYKKYIRKMYIQQIQEYRTALKQN